VFIQANPAHWFWLMVSILTAWRLTTLICYEAGPFNIVTAVRRMLYRFRLGALIDCFHCTAVWISLIVTISVYKISMATIFLTLAAAGGASIIEKLFTYLQTSKQEISNEND
jgi:hypothetical protein